MSASVAGRIIRRSQARPAASTVSSGGAISCRSPIASAAQPSRLNGRENSDSVNRSLSSSPESSACSSPASTGET